MKGLPLFDESARTAPVAGCSAEPSAGIGAAGPGLSKGHTVTNPSAPSPSCSVSTLNYWDGAGLLQVKNPYLGDFGGPPKNQGKRGEIIGHSRKSQRRARSFLATIPNEEIMNGLLVTLTYPGKQAADKIPDASEFEVYKNHLRKFNQAMKRKWEACGAWFLEFQTRGAPHYHLIVFGVDHSKLDPFQNWVSKKWNRIVDGGPDHLKAGTRVEIPKNCQAARSYVTAYFTKGAQAPPETKVGRFWGKFGRDSIPIAENVSEELTDQQAKIATRTARKAIERHVWNSSWKRFHRRCAKASPGLQDLTLLQFRTLCENCRKGESSHFLKQNGSSAWYASVFLEVIAMALRIDKVRFPRRFRHRNNSTVNLYCDATKFVETLKRHPRWLGSTVEESTRKPEGKREDLESFEPLIRRLKNSFLESEFEIADDTSEELESLSKSFGFEFEEGWCDATSTLFVTIRGRSGNTLLDLTL